MDDWCPAENAPEFSVEVSPFQPNDSELPYLLEPTAIAARERRLGARLRWARANFDATHRNMFDTLPAAADFDAILFRAATRSVLVAHQHLARAEHALASFRARHRPELGAPGAAPPPSPE